MIKFFSQNNFIQTPPGKQAVPDIENLRQDLAAAFAAAGIKESWVADHIIATIAEHGRLEHTPSAPSCHEAAGSRSNINFLISRMLVDTGYPDVANAFAKIREIPIPKYDANTKPWNEDRIGNVLRDALPLSESACHRLTAQVVKKMETLGFEYVADTLIKQLGEHILTAHALAEREKDSHPAGWLATPGYWKGCYSGETANLIRQGILNINPGTELFPAPRVKVNLKKLADSQDAAPLTELEFFPEARKVCDIAAEAIVEILSGNAPGYSSPAPGHLIINGITGSITTFLGTSSTAKIRQTSRDLENHIRASLEKYTPSGLITSFH